MDLPLPALVSHLTENHKSTPGVLFAISSYSWWAIVTPLYFKWLSDAPIVELLIWRILSGLPILILLLLFRKNLSACYRSLKDRKTLLLLLGSTIFISINWIVFVLAVVWDRLTEGSLGYYINPLVTVALGYFVLGERMRMTQVIAVIIALLAVVYLTIAQGSLPWISIALAGSFAIYGLLRKIMNVGSIEGLAIEMTFAYPICIGFQYWSLSVGKTAFHIDNHTMIFGLLIGGFVTIVPLLLFASGARRLKMSTLGILQYIAPTGQLILATLVFHEQFKQTQFIVFGLIWIAVLLYSFDAIKHDRLSKKSYA